MGPDEVESPVERYQAIRDELTKFDPDLATRTEVILLTKADLCSPADAEAHAAELRAIAPDRPLLIASAVSGRGIRPVTGQLWTLLRGDA